MTTTLVESRREPLAADTTIPADSLYEVVDGQVVEVIVGAIQVLIASRLQTCLDSFASQNRLGRAVTEMLFELVPWSGRKRRPDVAFVSYRRWPCRRVLPDTEAWSVVPELAVEVVSRTNTLEEIMGKMKEYFQAGVERVWVVLPKQQEVYVYESPTHVTILTRSDSLVGDPVVPGFTVPVSQLFDETMVDAAV